MIQRVATGSAPGIRGFANDAAKRAREMRLIRQATGESDLAERQPGLEHCALSEFDPPAHEVDVC